MLISVNSSIKLHVVELLFFLFSLQRAIRRNTQRLPDEGVRRVKAQKGEKSMDDGEISTLKFS